MSSIISRGRVPVARRQLAAEPAKLVVALVAVAAAVALVLLLGGLRRGMGEQVTLYLDRQAPVLVGQEGARDFLSQTSVLPEALVGDIERALSDGALPERKAYAGGGRGDQGSEIAVTPSRSSASRFGPPYGLVPPAGTEPAYRD